MEQLGPWSSQLTPQATVLPRVASEGPSNLDWRSEVHAALSFLPLPTDGSMTGSVMDWTCSGAGRSLGLYPRTTKAVVRRLTP